MPQYHAGPASRQWHEAWAALKAAIALMLVGLACPAAAAETLRGKVTEVLTGDSITLRIPDGSTRRVRLHALAAPEPRQAFAGESRRALSGLVLGKQVLVEVQRIDDYGRVIGKLLTSPPHCASCPQSRDAGLAQLEAGLAWWLREERRQQTLHDQGYYEYAEFDARNRRLGLWQDDSPIPPWEWRKRQGSLQSLRRSIAASSA